MKGLFGYTSWLQSIRAGNQGRNPSINLKKRPWINAACWLTCRLMHCQHFYTSRDHSPREWCHLQWAKSFCINEQSRDSPTTCHTWANCIKKITQSRLLSQVILEYVKLTIDVTRRETLISQQIVYHINIMKYFM